MKTTILLLACSCCLAVSAAAVAAEPAAVAVKDGGAVEFRNDNSERCIGVDHASEKAGAYIKQFKCDTAEYQWKVRAL